MFNWKCGDSTLASVYAVYEHDEQKGRVTTFGRGTFQVQATDAHLTLFTGSAEVNLLMKLVGCIILLIHLQHYHFESNNLHYVVNCFEINNLEFSLLVLGP